MRSQPQRDQQTLAIGSALAVFFCTVVIGIALGVIGAVSGAWDFDPAFKSAVLVAVVAGGLYLLRHRHA